MTRTTLFTGLALALALPLVGCAEQPTDDILKPKKPGTNQPAPEEHPANEPGAYSGDEGNTFDHLGDLSASGYKDPFEVLKARQDEGPPEIRSRLHSCQKLQNTAIRNVLEGFGVDLSATGNPPTAGQLINGGGQTLGAANYDSRQGEAITWTSAGAAKLFDIFVQAAPEVIANIETSAQCQIDGVGAPMFDADNRCVEDSVTCLIGRPAKAEHLAICDSIVENASDVETGKKIAVAALLSAAHSCE